MSLMCKDTKCFEDVIIVNVNIDDCPECVQHGQLLAIMY